MTPYEEGHAAGASGQVHENPYLKGWAQQSEDGWLRLGLRPKSPRLGKRMERRLSQGHRPIG